MTLSFSTKWPEGMGVLTGKPNYFVEKIWQSLPADEASESDFFITGKIHEHYDFDTEKAYEVSPKLHTIRIDTSGRWKAGMDIHPVINNRTKDRFQFAPTIKCVSVQSIEIKFEFPHTSILIDGELIRDHKATQLSVNDGFNSLEEFFYYFYISSEIIKGKIYERHFKGKIIHWTDLKY